MCGITGFLDFNRNSSPENLVSMSDTLAHRGPDGSDILFEDFQGFQLGMAHRRLSIIDLSDTGKQPMSYQSLSLVFNGEIYNYREIKSELAALGHQFVGQSDSEMILHAYQEWGEKCLDRFIGMFAFVIFDRNTQNLFCARDRAGVKPFFYYHHQHVFLFSSELKAFHQHPAFVKELEPASVAAFLQHGHVPSPYCIFKNCRKLKPGHYLKFHSGTRLVSEHIYWNVYDAYNRPKLDIGFDEAKRETEKILNSAFNYRMVSDVPVGVFLSGGYDSTCVAALLQKDRSEKLKTFTIGVKDSRLNEAPFARETAQYLGTDHHELYCDDKDALDLIPKLADVYDEPFGDQSAIPTMLVSRLAAQHLKVALSADGGDEVFAGYNRYGFLQEQGALLQRLPAPLRNLASSLMDRFTAEKIPYFGNTYNFANRYEKLKVLLRDPSPEKVMWSLSKQYRDEELSQLLYHPESLPGTYYTSTELRKEFYSGLSFMMAVDYQTYLLDDILQKVDRATMAFSLEGREPFLDQRIIEFVAQLPDHYKYHKGIKKYILREIVHQYIPKERMNRPKMGFAVPLETWLGQELKSMLLDNLSAGSLKKTGFFKEQEVEKMVREFLAGKKELSTKLWYILVFQMWYQRWMR